MQTGWKRNIGRVAALLGVLGVLLFGANPASAHARVGHITLDAASVGASHLTQTIHALDRHAHAPQRGMTSTASIADSDGNKQPSDCPHLHGRTCCAAASCPAFSLALAVGSMDLLSWSSASRAVQGAAMVLPAGVDGLPVTPPPRRNG